MRTTHGIIITYRIVKQPRYRREPTQMRRLTRTVAALHVYLNYMDVDKQSDQYLYQPKQTPGLTKIFI